MTSSTSSTTAQTTAPTSSAASTAAQETSTSSAASAVAQARLPDLMVQEQSTPISVSISTVGPVAIQAASVFASTKVKAPTEDKTTYSPEEFKILLLQKHPFPPNIIVAGNLDLSSSTLTSLPKGLTIQGNLNLSGCTGLTSLPEG